MLSLQQKMAEHGFESNDNYEYHLRCLLSSQVSGLRCLNIGGDSDRRMTAFANALSYALDYPNILYHDFIEKVDTPIIIESQDDRGKVEAPIAPLDRVMSEACAFSEGENTILILDQLQAADFKDHIRIYHFIKSGLWGFVDTEYTASKKHLLVFLISEMPIYHSLQKISFRVWVTTSSRRKVDYKPKDFQLGPEAWPMLNALADLFDALELMPTISEYERIIYDIHYNIRSIDCMLHSIYGWTEGVERELLFSDELKPYAERAIHVIEEFVGLDEVELTDVIDEPPTTRKS